MALMAPNPSNKPFNNTRWVLVFGLVLFTLFIACVTINYEHHHSYTQTQTVPHVLVKPPTPPPSPVKSPASPKDLSPSCHCDPDALDYAVLERLERAHLPTYDSDSGATEAQIRHEQQQIDQLHGWALNLQDRCLQDTYVKFLDVRQRMLDHAKQEPKVDSEYDQYEKKIRQQFAEAERCKREGIVPPVPKSVVRSGQ